MSTIFKKGYPQHNLHIQERPCQEIHKLAETFQLASHFSSTFEKQRQPWRTTSHHLFLAKQGSRCAGFAGIEIGYGAIIQAYLGQHQQNVLAPREKVCFVHAIEVAANFRGRGIQDYFWQHLSRYSLDHKINAIVLEPIHSSTYMHYFLKMGIEPKQHSFSRAIHLGLRSHAQIRYGEEEMNIIHLTQQDIQVAHDFLRNTTSNRIGLRL